jgi:hypothetical protein
LSASPTGSVTRCTNCEQIGGGLNGFEMPIQFSIGRGRERERVTACADCEGAAIGKRSSREQIAMTERAAKRDDISFDADERARIANGSVRARCEPRDRAEASRAWDVACLCDAMTLVFDDESDA